ncbi:DUF947-domain-containing protein [Saccharata proteae CBS 121410]|uniref:rRNA biogenesis protein RRP36 n=1 Tax=Saccharata proteae CBS 121410 TaxID=1314787 RepID=A0A9P4HQ18_9PEZI|nr:DUF947-domain-containing protein [Saccharata proteae CBS 121410]
MVLSRTLSRSIRAREFDDDDEPYSDELEGSSPSVLATGDDYGAIGSPDPESEGDDAASGEDDNVQDQLSKVSFGALAKAQEAIAGEREASRKRKRGTEGSEEQEEKLRKLRARLADLKKGKKEGKGEGEKKAGKKEGKAKKAKVVEAESGSEDEDGEDEDEDESDEDDKRLKGRTSKHAPAVQTSTKPVSRKRQILSTTKPHARDPRFDPLAGAVDANKLKHNYAFLEQYKESEMGELKAAIKNKKLNEGEREALKKKLLSMESQKKARERKEREEKVRREHMKKEREAVGEGKKNAFYLKKSEQKKLALVDQFANMKGKQRERLIERRRKKATAKERKNMPETRRGAE